MTVSARSGGLDAIRAVGALLVFGFHAQQATSLDLGLLGQGGGVGVVMFFVLSGYLLYRPFVHRTPDLGRYAIKRVARIYPAYLFALVGVAALNGAAVLVAHPLTFLMFGQNYDPSTWQRFLNASWTLATEVAFYVTLPLIAWAVRRRPLAGILGLAVASLALRALAWIVAGPDDQLLAIYPLMFWLFGPGMLVAAAGGRFRGHWPAGVALIAGALFVSPAAFGVAAHGGLFLEGALASIGAALVLPAALEWRPPRVLSWFGDRLSYAFYLWHGEVFTAALAIAVLLGLPGDPWIVPIAFVLAAAIAWVSSVLVERPALRLGADATHDRRPDPDPVQADVMVAVGPDPEGADRKGLRAGRRVRVPRLPVEADERRPRRA